MLHKPIDEMSLRHLFSTNFSKEILKIEYWGPVLNHLQEIEPSPDCLVIDKRQEPFLLKKCEFKFFPTSIKDFQHNGTFDIAIIWDLPNRIDRNLFKQNLREQNKCLEIIVLTDLIQFRRIPDYSIDLQANFALIQKMEKFLLSKEIDVVFSAYLIASAYPQNINSDKLANLLSDRFQRIRNMSPTGRSNSISRFLQTNPPLIKHRYSNNYCWNNDFEPKIAIRIMERLMIENFKIDIPSLDLISKIE